MGGVFQGGNSGLGKKTGPSHDAPAGGGEKRVGGRAIGRQREPKGLWNRRVRKLGLRKERKPVDLNLPSAAKKEKKEKNKSGTKGGGKEQKERLPHPKASSLEGRKSTSAKGKKTGTERVKEKKGKKPTIVVCFPKGRGAMTWGESSSKRGKRRRHVVHPEWGGRILSGPSGKH